MTSEFSVAVHALVFLNHKGGYLPSELLADNICTNPARVRKIMAQLKKAGLVETREGAEGGYRFTGDPARTTLLQIGDALDARYVCSNWRSGDVDRDCLICSGMGAILDGIYDDLNQACRAQLAASTLDGIDKKIVAPAADQPGKEAIT